MGSSLADSAIRQEIEQIPLVDTHEHFICEKNRLAQRLDLFYLFLQYASTDLISSGMEISDLVWIRDPSVPLAERWAKFAPYWARIKNTNYARGLSIAARDLFGVATISEDTYEILSERLQASNRPGWCRHVLRERANISASVVDVYGTNTTDLDRELFLPAIRFDKFILARSRMDLRELEKATSVAIHSLDDHLRALDVVFARLLREGMAAVKSALGYLRILSFEKVTRHEAETVFNRIFSFQDELRETTRPVPGMGLSMEESKPLQDFMMHQVIRRTIDAGLPIQVHTGLQAGNGAHITDANPTHLANLFAEYREAIFDVFHAGYPYYHEMATLAKNFPNVYADLCWLPLISSGIARRVLHEWIETVPGNKILAFGGDYFIVEGAYASARMARDVVASVLEEKVQEGYLSEEDALGLARGMLHDNAHQLFKVGAFPSIR